MPTPTPTPTPTVTVGYDERKCAQRNRLAARRDGVDAVPVRFLPNEIALASGADQDPERSSFARGTLPQSPQESLARINAKLLPGSPALTEEDVYMHFAEAVNDNFVRKYWMFLDPSTLRNAAADADRGIAFMNSHRTGGLSHPSELPFGRTFAGRYEQHRAEDGSVRHRALLGLYMLRGVHPTGTSGPSTDDLSAMIEAGTVSDVSVGLVGGVAVCDLCGLDVDTEECEHIPGTTHALSDEQVEAQRARGVPGGAASYTLVDAHIAEVSAVFKGAVPGAGFRKALAAERAGRLTSTEHAQVRGAYRALFDTTTEDIDMHEYEAVLEQASDSIASKVMSGLRSLFSAGDADTKPAPAPTPAPATPPAADAAPEPEGEEEEPGAGADPETPPTDEGAEPEDAEAEGASGAAPATASQPDLAAQVRKLTQEKADAFATSLVRERKLLPAGKAALSAAYARALSLDALSPEPVSFTDATGTERTLSLADTLAQAFSALPPHTLTEELRVGKIDGALVLTGGRDEESAKAEEQAEVERVLATTSTGRAILAQIEAQRSQAASHNGNGNGRNGRK